LSSVPRLAVNVTAKDQLVNVLECNATTVRGVTSSAMFVWKSNNKEVDRADVSGTPMDNLIVFTHTHTTFGELSNSTSTVYKCYVEINTKNATGEIAISKSFTLLYAWMHIINLFTLYCSLKYDLHVVLRTVLRYDNH